MPLKLYLTIGGALILMTILTVIVAQIPLGPFNLVVALAIATIKATLVGLFFMHLKYDNKLYALIFVSAIAFLGIFITLTMFDTVRRDDLYQQVGTPFKPDAIIYKSPGVPIKAAPEHEGHAEEHEGK